MNKRKIKQTQPLEPGLYLVASPIGNAGDISLRAAQILENADSVYCEDTSHSRILFARLGITPRQVFSAYAHNEEKAARDIAARIRQGEIVAYISDAGMPLISDPGFALVRRLIEEKLYVTSIPGANAALTALQLSGLPSQPFYFAGFLPPREKERAAALQNLKAIPATLIFYEAPHRLIDGLKSLLANLGDRPAALARELTKMHEELLRGSLSGLLANLEARAKILGECVIIVAPPAPEAAKTYTPKEIGALLKTALKSHSRRDAAALLAEQTGIKKRDLYRLLIEMDEEK
jgi:16S rRNA (cytidine1402-2'-O)-methyltransferase